jgi:hypothetical protein
MRCSVHFPHSKSHNFISVWNHFDLRGIDAFIKVTKLCVKGKHVILLYKQSKDQQKEVQLIRKPRKPFCSVTRAG